ncbi:class I SAM-dependent methyltransferase [Candidatus Parcubacteria bacterium]|nr:MAG: class I SAM-dependent methyltransferase [Candidatus Parcubacteria bacterium]
MASADRFAFEWQTYAAVLPEYEEQFRRWMAPLGPADIAGKRVLDAGCGMGRNSVWALRWGAAEVVAFDADGRSVAAAQANLASYPNVRVQTLSVYDAPWTNEFDLAFSIGVIHHLADPAAAVRKLADAVRPGGRVHIWVYGYEGNEWIERFVSPVRRAITSHLPPPLLHVLTYGCSAPLYVFLRVWPVKHPYLRQIRNFRFSHLHSIAFDQLLPAIARYYRRSEAEELLRQAGLEHVSVVHVNGNSWAVDGRKPVA